MCYTTSPHNVPTEIERKGFVKIWHEWAVFSKSVTIKRRKFINLTISKNMHVRRKLSAFDKGRAISLLQEGHSLRSCRRLTECEPLCYTQTSWQSYTERMLWRTSSNSGRPRKTNLREDRKIQKWALQLRHSTANELRHHLRQVTHKNVSDQTIRNKFSAIGFHSRRPVKKPIHTYMHKVNRFAYVRWTH